MALEVADCVERPEGQTEAGAIQTDQTFRWNTSVFILVSIIGSATGDPRAGCLLPLRAEGADDVGLLEDARRLGMAGTVEAGLDARARPASCEGPVRLDREVGEGHRLDAMGHPAVDVPDPAERRIEPAGVHVVVQGRRPRPAGRHDRPLRWAVPP